jgi:hypothetical protein
VVKDEEERQLARMEVEISYLKKGLDEHSHPEACEKCLVRKVVFAVIGVMGLGIVGAILALVLRR